MAYTAFSALRSGRRAPLLAALGLGAAAWNWDASRNVSSEVFELVNYPLQATIRWIRLWFHLMLPVCFCVQALTTPAAADAAHKGALNPKVHDELAWM